MKYSRSTITQLKKWYKSVLFKCALINTGLFFAAGILATPASAVVLVFNGTVYDGEEVTLDNDTDFPVYSIWGDLTNNATMTGMILKNGEQNAYYDDEDPYYGYIENNGTINLSRIFSNTYGKVFNNGAITAAQLVNEDEFTNNGNITLTEVDGMHSVIDNYGSFLNGVKMEFTETDDSFTQTLGATTGSIKGDIVNRGRYFHILPGSVRPTKVIRYRLGRGFTSNGTIEGDIFNEDMFMNGVNYSATYYEDESKEPTIVTSGIVEASIKSDAIWSYGQFINGGTIEADIIYNGLMFDNGLINAEITATPEPLLLEGAEITARKIYNGGLFTNAGTINGNIVNLAYPGRPAAVNLRGGTVNGDIISAFPAEEDADKFDKFAWLYGLDDEDEEGGNEGPTAALIVEEEAELSGWVRTYGNTESTVTGRIEAEVLGVNSGSSLTVGDNIKAGYLYVGKDTLMEGFEDEEPLSINTDEREDTPKPVNLKSRLDIGTNQVDTQLAYFDADSTLALTVNSESEYGKVVAGAFNIEKGATLEMTVNPGFEEEKEYTLQILEQTGESDYAPYYIADADLDIDEDDGLEVVEVSEKFNNFTEDFKFAENAMFEISRAEDKEGAYVIKQIKKAEDISEETGGDKKHKGAAKAWLDEGPLTTPASIAMAAKLAHVAQHDKDNLNNVISDLIPSDSPTTAILAIENSNRIFNGVSSHLDDTAGGLASGDPLEDVSIWGGAYLGKTKLDNREASYGFDANSKGVTLGLDKKITPTIKLGLGFQYDETDVDGHHRDTDVSTTSGFVYGEYRPNRWFVNAVATYGSSDYDEKKHVLGQTVKANYTVDAYALQGLTGYDLTTKYLDITPTAGLRYNYIKRHGYIDGADQRVSGKDLDILTAVAGVKLTKDYTLSCGHTVRPDIYLGVTYDLVSDRDNSIVNLTNGASYTVAGKRLNRFGFEVGAGLTADITDRLSANISYAGDFRSDFKNHTGLLGLKYSF